MYIKNKADYIRFLKSEHPYTNKDCFLFIWIQSTIKPTSRFLLLLRTCEYYKNCKSGYSSKIIYYFLKYLLYRKGIQLGFSIPENVVDEGFQLPHYGTIVINAASKIGKNCRIHVNTNIGASGMSSKAPVLGDNVYVAPGVKIYGNITIGNNIALAANSVIQDSFSEDNYLLGGVPAKPIKRIDISKVMRINIK